MRKIVIGILTLAALAGLGFMILFVDGTVAEPVGQNGPNDGPAYLQIKLKNGNTVEGLLVDYRNGFYTIRRASGAEVSVSDEEIESTKDVATPEQAEADAPKELPAPEPKKAAEDGGPAAPPAAQPIENPAAQPAENTKESGSSSADKPKPVVSAFPSTPPRPPRIFTKNKPAMEDALKDNPLLPDRAPGKITFDFNEEISLPNTTRTME